VTLTKQLLGNTQRQFCRIWNPIARCSAAMLRCQYLPAILRRSPHSTYLVWWCRSGLAAIVQP
jgi:hypothetical protein